MGATRDQVEVTKRCSKIRLDSRQKFKMKANKERSNTSMNTGGMRKKDKQKERESESESQEGK